MTMIVCFAWTIGTAFLVWNISNRWGQSTNESHTDCLYSGLAIGGCDLAGTGCGAREAIAMKPICIPCQRFFRPKKNDYSFIEGMPIDNGALPGTQQPELWKPYKLWRGDKWECEGCGAAIVVGVAQLPVAEHYQPNFDKAVAMFRPELQVNDC
jgi:hypothetical protein